MPSSTTRTTSTPRYIEAGTASEKWKPSQPTTLQSLLAIVDGPDETLDETSDDTGDETSDDTGDDTSDSDPMPWRPGHSLRITGTGGLHDLERRRISIAPGGYSKQTLKNLTLNVTGNYDLTVDGDQTLSIGPHSSSSSSPSGTSDTDDSESSSPSAGTGDTDDSESSSSSSGTDDTNASDRLAGTLWGRDKLVVRGEANMSAKDRLTLISGTYQRFWSGGIVKLAGMEGVICGGVFVRVHTGPSATIAVLCSGDVYGGAARASGVRTYVAAMNYRAAVAAAWACGAYVRSTSFTIEPVLGSPSQDAPTKNLAKKAGKIAHGPVPLPGHGGGRRHDGGGALGSLQGGLQKGKENTTNPATGSSAGAFADLRCAQANGIHRRRRMKRSWAAAGSSRA